MILLDLSGITVASIHIALRELGQPSESDIRHLMLNSIRRLNKKFKNKYGTMVICCDDRTYWRDTEFEFYKWKRREDKKTKRATDNIDWAEIYTHVDTVKQEIKENLPYHFVDVKTAEADDIIGTLCLEFGSEKTIILSRDGDFKQLHTKNVKQYDPITDKQITVENAKLYLSEHIIRGDSGDGIPNILSDDDVFSIKDKRQTPMQKKKVDMWVGEDPKDFCDTTEMLANYYRNEKLISLNHIPKDLYKSILTCYNTGINTKNSNVFTYLVKNKMKNMLDDCSDFHSNLKPTTASLF